MEDGSPQDARAPPSRPPLDVTWEDLVGGRPPRPPPLPGPPEPAPPPPNEVRAAGPFPPVARLLVGAGAAATLAFFLAQAANLSARGFPITGATLAATTVVFGAALASVAIAPGAVQDLLGRRSRVDLRRSSHVFALAFLAAVLFVVVGLNSLLGGALAFERSVVQGEGADVFRAIGAGDVAFSLILNAFLLVIPPLVWLSVVHGQDVRGALLRLGLKPEGAGRAALLGAGLAVAFILALVLVAFALERGDVEVPENEQALAIARSVGVVGALLVAVASGVTEEVFFRGFLQPRIGLVAQAAVFSLAHLSYVNAAEIVVTFVLGLAFGLLFRRTGNLWAPVSAHFTFNLVMLLAAQAVP